MSLPTSLKRPRTESTTSVMQIRDHPHTTEWTMSERFNFRTKGDICIRVDKTLYLLPRIPLQTHSRLFLPDSLDHLDSRETYLDQRVYVPPWDNVPDWECLMAAVYEPANLTLWGSAARSDELFSLIRVAKRLKFDTIFSGCMLRLQTELPSTLDEFDRVYILPMTGSILRASEPRNISNKEKLFRTINLALEFDQKRDLACAYFLALMEASVEETMDGLCSADGTRVQLLPKAKKALLLAHSRIYLILLHRFSATISPPKAHRSCTSKPVSPGCRSAANDFEASIRLCIAGEDNAKKRRLVIAPLCKAEWFGDLLNNRCSACRCTVKEQVYESRKKVWDDVPGLFGLGGSWGDVKNAPLVKSTH